jgi:hypothetical protein
MRYPYGRTRRRALDCEHALKCVYCTRVPGGYEVRLPTDLIVASIGVSRAQFHTPGERPSQTRNIGPEVRV